MNSYNQGFRMTVGAPTTNSLDNKRNVGLRFVCLTDKNTRFPELPDFPTKACKGGIMTVHHFPSYVIETFSGKFLGSLMADAGMARILTRLTTR